MTSKKARSRDGAESRSTFRSLQHTGPVRLLLKGFMRATGFMPVWALRTVGLLFVCIFILATPANFRAIMQNLRRINPGSGLPMSFWGAVQVYKCYSYYLIDLFYISHDPEHRISEYSITVTGYEKVQEAVDSGRGILLLTSHLGNWEIGGYAIDFRGKPMHLLYSPDSSDILERQRREARGTSKIVEIPLVPGQFNSLRLLRVLQDGGLVAVQGDRLLMDRGVPVEFFGSSAMFPQGPVKLTSLSGSWLVPVFIPMKGYKKYEVIIGEPMEFAEGDEVQWCVSKIAGEFETYISRFPTQWYTFMPFWDEDRKRRGLET